MRLRLRFAMCDVGSVKCAMRHGKKGDDVGESVVVGREAALRAMVANSFGTRWSKS
jgi:hypothetical protein